MKHEDIEKLYQELRSEYKRVNGREFREHAPIEGKLEEWRVAMMMESIKIFKTLPSYNIEK